MDLFSTCIGLKTCASSSNKGVQYSKRKYAKLSEVVNGHFTSLIRGGWPRNVPKFITHVHSSCLFGDRCKVQNTVLVFSKFPIHHLLQASLSISGNFCYFFLNLSVFRSCRQSWNFLRVRSKRTTSLLFSIYCIHWASLSCIIFITRSLFMFLDEKKQGNYRNTTKSAANLLELSTI